MDTRSKIIDPEEAARVAGDGALTVVAGAFDVLLAEHARELQRVRNRTPQRRLLVALLPPAEPVLEARARAELIAALAVVDYVVTADETGLQDLMKRLPVAELIRAQSATDERTRQLIEHVHRRQRS